MACERFAGASPGLIPGIGPKTVLRLEGLGITTLGYLVVAAAGLLAADGVITPPISMLGAYEPLGVPRVQAIHSGPMYHTSGDTLNTISTPGLERASRFYAYFVTEIARADKAALHAR